MLQASFLISSPSSGPSHFEIGVGASCSDRAKGWRAPSLAGDTDSPRAVSVEDLQDFYTLLLKSSACFTFLSSLFPLKFLNPRCRRRHPDLPGWGCPAVPAPHPYLWSRRHAPLNAALHTPSAFHAHLPPSPLLLFRPSQQCDLLVPASGLCAGCASPGAPPSLGCPAQRGRSLREQSCPEEQVGL